ncbi:MAG: hypothetical protein DHS20C14_10250 [Phycisphaeraceae bacterium]|nr:MAG: hypothetical protein DHS20C14_10250 [Phycisphaeraceae bacterium]
MRQLRAVVRALDTVESRPVRWLWPRRAAVGKVTLLAGDPGLGKSFVTLDLAARVSTGVLPESGSQCEPGPHDVLLLSAEDDPGDTIRPRLEKLGADLRRIHCVGGVRLDDAPRIRQLSLDTHLAQLADCVKLMSSPKLLIVDPISAYMGKVDSHNNAETRGLLAELGRFAEHFGMAVVCVTHLNKSGAQGKAVYRAMGSLAFTAAARIVLLVSKHPDDQAKRLVVPVKNNLTRDAESLVYRIEDDCLSWVDEACAYTADDLEASADAGDKPDALGEAVEWLGDALKDGPRGAREVLSEAKGVGIAEITLKRAKRTLGVIARPSEGVGSAWTWSLRRSGS